jgi:hypothetical protein
MSDNAFEPRSAAQFQIKHVLWAMLPASVLFAVAAPWLRSLPADARNRVLIFWVLSGGLTCASVAFCLRKRLRLERQKGLPELVFYQPVARWRRIASALVIPSVLVYWGAASYAASMYGHNYSAQLWRAIYPSIAMGWLFQGLWLGRRRIEVFAEGFAMAGEQFIPWPVIYRYEWRQTSVPTLNLYCKWSVERTMFCQTLRVPPDLTAMFTALLESRCPSLQQPTAAPATETNRHALSIQPLE